MPTTPQPEPSQKNRLYYGDNLQVLSDYIATESVDLIYLDPPFNSRQNSPILPTKLRDARSPTPFSLKENGTPRLLPFRSIREMGYNVLFAEKTAPAPLSSSIKPIAFTGSREWNEETVCA